MKKFGVLGLLLGVALLAPGRPAQAEKSATCTCKHHPGPQLGLWVRLRPKADKVAELEKFLQQGQALAQQEAGTPLWFALRFADGSYAIFDAFRDEAGRKAHLDGKIAKALQAQAATLLAEPPRLETFDISGQKGH